MVKFFLLLKSPFNQNRIEFPNIRMTKVFGRISEIGSTPNEWRDIAIVERRTRHGYELALTRQRPARQLHISCTVIAMAKCVERILSRGRIEIRAGRNCILAAIRRRAFVTLRKWLFGVIAISFFSRISI